MKNTKRISILFLMVIAAMVVSVPSFATYKNQAANDVDWSWLTNAISDGWHWINDQVIRLKACGGKF